MTNMLHHRVMHRHPSDRRALKTADGLRVHSIGTRYVHRGHAEDTEHAETPHYLCALCVSAVSGAVYMVTPWFRPRGPDIRGR